MRDLVVCNTLGTGKLDCSQQGRLNFIIYTNKQHYPNNKDRSYSALQSVITRRYRYKFKLLQSLNFFP
jgi:hypothetical protein